MTNTQALVEAAHTTGLDLASATRHEQAITDNWYAKTATHDDVKAARLLADEAARAFGYAIGRLKEAVR